MRGGQLHVRPLAVQLQHLVPGQGRGGEGEQEEQDERSHGGGIKKARRKKPPGRVPGGEIDYLPFFLAFALGFLACFFFQASYSTRASALRG